MRAIEPDLALGDPRLGWAELRHRTRHRAMDSASVGPALEEFGFIHRFRPSCAPLGAERAAGKVGHAGHGAKRATGERN